MTRLGSQEIADAELTDWRKLAQALAARYLFGTFTEGAAFVTAVAEAADAANHRPVITVQDGIVDVSVCTRQDGIWITAQDIDLARKISAIAAEQGLSSRPWEVSQLEWGLDTAHEDLIGAFWSALLTGSPDNKIHDSVFDPTGRVSSMWFQETDEHPTPRQRWHGDLWLAPEAAAPRISAAVAAGGTVVDDSHAPSFTVLADPDGNKVCICTSQDRS